MNNEINIEMIREIVRTEVKLALQELQQTDLLTSKQVCEYLGISNVTLWKYKKQGKFNCYTIDKKQYYKKSELLDQLSKL